MGEEAARRGLDNLESTPDCLERLLTAKSITLFTKHHIYTEDEIRSRHDILLENYVKTIAIEARTMVDILSRDFLPNSPSLIPELLLPVRVQKKRFSLI